MAPVRIGFLIKRWFKKQSSKVNHQAVLKHVHREVDISAGYFVLLTLANLIALIGLIQNSSPVIIGAMLISPLMDTILSFGFSFITGDRLIWKKSLRKISLSLILTIAVAAFASFFSPLKDITQEIIARTRPNLYDLIIAFLAGTAGVAALCTKRNYLTIVPGVAITTSVIPPLSVAGFGLGIGRLDISMGSFLLFFTNFVAIVLSAVVVLFLYGFRPRTVSEKEISGLKKRMISLAVVLFVISIPLIYTLNKTISDVRLRSMINNALSHELNRPGESRLSSFSYLPKDRKLEIFATINTVRYLKNSEMLATEGYLKKSLGRDVSISVEQVKVHPGGLREEPIKPFLPATTPPKTHQEVMRDSRETVLSLTKKPLKKIGEIIAPAIVADFSVSFQDKTSSVSLLLKIRRDTPLSQEEVIWLRRMLASDLGFPVELSVETVPFVPLLIFPAGQTGVSPEMKAALDSIRRLAQQDRTLSCFVEAYPEKLKDRKKAKTLAEERTRTIIGILSGEYMIPEERIKSLIHANPQPSPAVKVSVISG